MSLVQNLDVFAWSPYEIPRVNLDYIMHKLNVDPLIPPKKQRLRRSAKSHVEAVREEVENGRGPLRKCFPPEWLANTVMVNKNNGKWRVCVDFIDLNRACPKDSFPVLKIDQLVEATVGRQRISFLDAF